MRIGRTRLIVSLTLGLLVWSLSADAQQPMPVIGYLSSGSPESDNIPARLVAFRRGLNDMGYVEGQNVAIEYRWAQLQYDRLPELAADLVRRRLSRSPAPLRHSLPRQQPRQFRSFSTRALTRSNRASSPASTGQVATSQVSRFCQPSWRESDSMCCTNCCRRRPSLRC